MKISVMLERTRSRLIRISYVVELMLTYRDSYVRSCVLVLSVSHDSLMNEG